MGAEVSSLVLCHFVFSTVICYLKQVTHCGWTNISRLKDKTMVLYQGGKNTEFYHKLYIFSFPLFLSCNKRFWSPSVAGKKWEREKHLESYLDYWKTNVLTRTSKSMKIQLCNHLHTSSKYSRVCFTDLTSAFEQQTHIMFLLQEEDKE